MENPNSIYVSDAFSRQAKIFDDLNEKNKISAYLRQQFRNEVTRHLQPASNILELNCGTGLDAIYLAGLGHSVHATDNAPGMLSELEKKINTQQLKNITIQRCSFHELNHISKTGFDHIVSNFGGLNCTDQLEKVLRQFAPLLNENGKVTLMIMPKVCPWELIMLLKGKVKTAFRRFRKRTPAHIEGVYFSCYYYNPGYVSKALKQDFEVESLQGVCVTVPPEFYQDFIERYPRLFSFLSKLDEKICRIFPFTHCCDHFLITLRKKN